VSDAYLTTAEAATLGATLTAFPGVSDLLAEADAALEALLLAASIDLDHAMPYQGAKYDADQVRAFPRYAHRVGSAELVQPSERAVGVSGFPAVWDWDDDANAAVAPRTVKIACILQAADIRANPEHRQRLDAIRSGLASQSIGSHAESYVNPGDLPGGLTGLCDRAQRLMEPYRLKTSPMI